MIVVLYCTYDDLMEVYKKMKDLRYQYQKDFEFAIQENPRESLIHRMHLRDSLAKRKAVRNLLVQHLI